MPQKANRAICLRSPDSAPAQSRFSAFTHSRPKTRRRIQVPACRSRSSARLTIEGAQILRHQVPRTMLFVLTNHVMNPTKVVRSALQNGGVDSRPAADHRLYRRLVTRACAPKIWTRSKLGRIQHLHRIQAVSTVAARIVNENICVFFSGTIQAGLFRRISVSMSARKS
jgi:hypothetical protein